MIFSAISDSKNQIAKQHKDNLKLEFIDPKDVFIEADKDRINQVISNLLNNAINFTKEGTVNIIAVVVPKNNEIVVNIYGGKIYYGYRTWPLHIKKHNRFPWWQDLGKK